MEGAFAATITDVLLFLGYFMLYKATTPIYIMWNVIATGVFCLADPALIYNEH